MENFIFFNDTTILFGKGQIKNLGNEISKQQGSRVLLTYGSDRVKKNGLLTEVESLLKEAGLEFIEYGGIVANPRISSVREGIELIRKHNLDFILAVGGGSVLDASKAMAAGFYIEGDPWQLFKGTEVKKALPLASVLTLAATGSEMNGNAVVSNPETGEKLGMGSSLVRPRFSILDPEYTFSVPAYQTAAGAADIMSHVFEQYFSPSAHTELQDRISEAIILTVKEWAPVAVEDGTNYEARANLLWASTLALNGLISTGKRGDWATHSMEHAVSAVNDMTHGAGLAVLFPNWMMEVLDKDQNDRFYNMAVRVWDVELHEDKKAVAIEGIKRIREFFNSLGLPAKLSENGIDEKDLPTLVEKSMTWNGPLGSFGQLDEDQVKRIFTASI
jgi:alcohol dehydrogenase YqhD (iron-dependent ADH family)